MVSEQEKREVQCLSAIYPELASYIAEIEDELADAVLVEGVTPPGDLKTRILENLPDREENEQEEIVTPVIHLVRDHSDTGEEEEKEKPSRSGFPWGMAAAVAVIVGLGAMYMNTLTDNRSLEEQLLESQSENAIVGQSNQDLLEERNRLAADLESIKDPDMRKIALNGLPGHEDARVMVYWNANTQKVMLEAVNLPEAPEGSQYQLWTLVGGSPIDQGVIPLEGEGLTVMKSADAADAFAITLEPVGGSESPTLEQLIVLGEVDS